MGAGEQGCWVWGVGCVSLPSECSGERPVSLWLLGMGEHIDPETIGQG